MSESHNTTPPRRTGSDAEGFSASLEGCLPWATPRETEAIKARIKYGTNRAAARAIGSSESRFRALLSNTRKRAAKHGWCPEHDLTRPVAPGFHVRGYSAYYPASDDGPAVWVKANADQQRQYDALVEAIGTIAEPFRGKSETTPKPRGTTDDLLTVYPLGDPHLGMFAWAKECGESFDLQIAERNLVAAVDQVVALAPPSKQALIVNLGDFFHSDNVQNRTARSGNALDVDTRWAKVLRAGIRTMRRCIDRAAEKHETVRVINEIGNHDDHSAIMLSLALDQYYENNPRVQIDTSPEPFHWHRFGKCLIGVTHGDKVKAQNLPGVMANDRAQDWGETKHRYWYTGHVHHDTRKEFPGCIVETFRTLAARDAWHHGQGYRSGRDMNADILHREHGRICRHTVGIEMLGRAA